MVTYLKWSFFIESDTHNEDLTDLPKFNGWTKSNGWTICGFVNITKVPMNILRGKYRDAEIENWNIVFSFFKKKIRKEQNWYNVNRPCKYAVFGT